MKEPFDVRISKQESEWSVEVNCFLYSTQMKEKNEELEKKK